MKAKEYAESFLSGEYKTEKEVEQAVWNICIDFFKECEELAKARHSKSDECLISIFKEQSRKWKAFASIVNARAGIDYIKPKGFMDFIVSQIPQLKGRI